MGQIISEICLLKKIHFTCQCSISKLKTKSPKMLGLCTWTVCNCLELA